MSGFDIQPSNPGATRNYTLPDSDGVLSLVPKITRFIPTTGQTITIPDCLSDQIIIIAPATDLAALTIAWPATPYNGQCIRIVCTKNITVVTHTNGTLNRSVGSIIATGDMNFIYDLAATTYMCDGLTVSPVISLAFTATVAGGAGNCVFYATADGTSTGIALFSNIQSIQPSFDVADPLKAFSKPVISNSNKTITTLCQISQQNLVTILGISVIGSTSLVAAPNATALTFLVHGTLN